MGKMLFRSRWLGSIALLLLVAAALGSVGDRALAVRNGETVLFGPVGVAPHEAVRVSVSRRQPGSHQRPKRRSMGLYRADLQQTR